MIGRTIKVDWDDNWTTLVNSLVISASTFTQLSTPISLDGKIAVQVGILTTFGATVSAPLKLYTLGECGNNEYETTISSPVSVSIPSVANTSTKYSFVIPASEVKKFKLLFENNTGAAISVTANYAFAYNKEHDE